MTPWRLYLDDDSDGSRPPSATIENPTWRAQVGLPSQLPAIEHLGSWVTARSAAEARAQITRRGFPSFVAFDHDLGDGEDGIAVVAFLIDLDLDFGTLPDAFAFEVHSKNPVGRANIEGRLQSYLRVRRERSSQFMTP